MAIWWWRASIEQQVSARRQRESVAVSFAATRRIARIMASCRTNVNDFART